MKKYTFIFILAIIIASITASYAGSNPDLKKSGNFSSSVYKSFNDDLNTSYSILSPEKKRRSSNSQLMFGGQIGLIMANVTGDVEDVQMKMGFSAGLSCQYNIDEMLGIQVEVNFDSKGAKSNSTVTDDYFGYTVTTKYDEKYKLNYITVPIMAKVMFGEKPQFFVNAGPYIGLLSSAKWEGEQTTTTDFGGTVTDTTITIDEDAKDFYSSTDFGITAGAGVIFPVEFGKRGPAMNFFLNARYSLGLANIMNQDELPDVEAKNSAIEVKFGVLIGLD